jgi:chromosome partitioning protein
MNVIAVANEKGGVAKTTTTISLGGAFVEAGEEVLLIDLDPQANLTLGLGVSPAKLRRSIADVFMSSASLLSVSRETEIPGLDFVPSSPSMGFSERLIPMRKDYEFILRTALETVTSYDFVIIDCPPSLGAVTLNALTAADRVITPTQPEYFSVYGLRSILGLIRKIRGVSLHNKEPQASNGENFETKVGLDEGDQMLNKQGSVIGNPSRGLGTNPDLVYHILITMMDRRNRIHRTLRDQLKQTFTDGLLDTVIEIDTKLRESTLMGQPISIYASNTRSANQYRALAEEINSYVKEKTAKQA